MFRGELFIIGDERPSIAPARAIRRNHQRVQYAHLIIGRFVFPIALPVNIDLRFVDDARAADRARVLQYK